MYENLDKNAVYTVFQGDIGELASEITDFCHGKYGDRCEFYTVAIERHHPDGNSWKVHEFTELDERVTRAVRNHLKARRDLVKLKFGGADRDYELDFIICPARNTGQLARYVKKQHIEELEGDDLVVLAVERKRKQVEEEHRELLEKLEGKMK